MPGEKIFQKLIHPPVHRAAYSDRTAWILANCSHLAYEPSMPRLARELKVFGLRLTGKFFCDQNQNFAYLAQHESYAVLAFKGTVPSQIRTVETDADFKLVQAKYGEIHQGFLDTFKELSKQIEPALKKVKVPVYVTGHSLGGALSLLATTLLKDQDKLAACFNYGCPRVGNDLFADRLFKVPVYRCVHHADLVPGVPFFIMGYRQYGDMRYLTDKGRVCGGSEAFIRRFLAMLNPLNMPQWIADHGIKNYIRILREYAESRNP
jgi:triacylglycerol lipase